MKILFTRFPLESRYGGAEIQTMSLMKGLIAKGHAVSFLGSCPTLLKLTEEENIPRTELHIGPPPVSKWTTFSFLWRRQMMQWQLERTLGALTGIDAIFMLSLSEKILLTEFAQKKGLKVFWVEHDRIGRWLAKNPWLPNLKHISEHATTVVVSELSRRKYMELGWNASKTVAIPNGIDLNRLAGDSRMDVPHKGALHIGTVARLTEDKGVDVLVQAIRDDHDITLDIVGSGRDEGFVRTLVDAITEKEMTDTPRIRMVRSIPDLGSFYRSLDAFVLPSRDHDPFGLVAAEAMALGVPTIVTDQCGIADYLTHGQDALVAKAGDAADLRRRIDELRVPERRHELAERATRTARERFGVDAMVDAYARLLA